MLLPQTAEYALRATIHIAAHADQGSLRVNGMAAELEIPQNYLAKTLHQLVRAGVLASTRGPTGGFRLARPAGELRLTHVIAPFVESGPRKCLIANRPCGQDPSCPVHQRWAPVAIDLDAFFDATTVAELIADPTLLSPGGRVEGAATPMATPMATPTALPPSPHLH